MPTLKLNARAIPGLKPRPDGKREVYRDTVVSGLYVEAHASGVRTFGVWYRVAGTGRAGRLTLGSYAEGVYDLADARSDARDALHKARKGADPAEHKRRAREACTLGDLVNTFLAGVQASIRPATHEHWSLLLKHDRLAGLRAMKPHEVQRADVIRLLDRIAEGAPYSANRTFEAIRRCYSWAMSKALVEHTPCVGILKPAKEEPRSRAYSDEELARLVASLADEGTTGDAVTLCLYTGTRIRQALGAEWSEFNLDKKEWRIPGSRAGTKNAMDWLVPLTEPVVLLLKQRRDQAGEFPTFVFPVRQRKGSTTGHAWRQQRAMVSIQERSGISDFRPHDLRRTLDSWLAAQRVPREVRDAVLGHKSPRLERTYNVYDYASEKRKALERWARHVQRVMTTAAEEKVVPMVRA